MSPIHDVDLVLLLASALASKRRAAELSEIIAGIELVQPIALPAVAKIAEAFARLSGQGLLVAAEGRFALSPEAQTMIEALPKKADTAERLVALRPKLSAFRSNGESASILIEVEQVNAAILEYRAAAASARTILVLAKPKTEERPGQRRRKPFPGSKRGR
ncbi:hypothetical protein [Rhodocyclus purpureus]|uniref:hypothetical protein n=1 Tax=Rhodocyclus purpureus TaxID=1067 RepID=UPI0019123920|nr:hypothetical protein [Rhodocyclus purpureus]MBK5914237.1 hypothetical protein [Rhodocyclus purpureus]